NPQSVRFDGPGGTTSTAAFDAGGDDGQAIVTIPTGLANGLYDVRVVLVDNSASNPRTLEIIPRLDSPEGAAVVAGANGNVHQLTLQGARLNGADVRLLINGVVYQAGANGNAGQFVFTMGRLLSGGAHQLAINVDGQQSRPVDLII